MMCAILRTGNGSCSASFFVSQKKDKGDLSQLSYLIYWYGADQDSAMYGFVAPRAFIPYEVEKAKTKSAHKLPERIRTKVEQSGGDASVLNAKDLALFRGYKEMEEDLQNEPSERKRGLRHRPGQTDDNDNHQKEDNRRRPIDVNDVRAVKSRQRRRGRGVQ
jgi:hypothetical protein